MKKEPVGVPVGSKRARKPDPTGLSNSTGDLNYFVMFLYLSKYNFPLMKLKR